MASLTTGQRLKSSVCTTEIMVISAPPQELELSCGGTPMNDDGDSGATELHPEFAEGTTIGKRYVDAEGQLELLCVKPGEGSLSVGGVALKLKESKKLPKTD